MAYTTNHFQIENIPDTLRVFGAHAPKAERKNQSEYFHSRGKKAITQKLTQELGKNIARDVPTAKFTMFI